MRKIGLFIAPLLSLMFLPGCNKADPIPTYSITASTTEVTVEPGIATKGQDYVGKIKVATGISKCLPDSLDYVKLITDDIDIIDDCEYRVIDDLSADFSIPKEYVKSNIEIGITLKATYSITASTTEVTIEPNMATEGRKYVGKIKVAGTLSKYLPSFLDYVKLLDGETDITDACDYNLVDYLSADFSIPKEYVKSNIEIGITLSDIPPVTYSITASTTDVAIEPNIAVQGQRYVGKIKVAGTISKYLPPSLDYVKLLDDDTDIIDDCEYQPIDHLTANFSIPKVYIRSNIKIGITLSDIPPTNKWIVSFNTDGGSFVPSQRVENGETAIKPKVNPIKTDYTFDGWYKDGEVTEFDFDTPITDNTVLKAKWINGPDPLYYHFRFIGENCSINGSSRYETNILKNQAFEFAIVPNKNYDLPINDSEHFKVVTGSTSNITYDDTTGLIQIEHMVDDIEIQAISKPAIEEYYVFDFYGTNCTVNNVSHYTKRWIKPDDIFSFTIVPKSGYKLPNKDKGEIIIEGEGADDTTYENGVISIGHLDGNVKVIANAPIETEEFYTISFNGYKGEGIPGCKADTNPEATSPSYNFFTIYGSEATTNLTLYLFPDDGYILPDDISVMFDDGVCELGDYEYSRDAKTITIIKKANAMITLETTKYMLTFDAGEGSYNGIKTIKVAVDGGVNLVKCLQFLTVRPKLDGTTFGYYSYADDTLIDYDDVVDRDNIQIKAHYLNITSPTGNLNNFNWKTIKGVAVTNNTPTECFKLGATKTITLNGIEQSVRLIGFSHDSIVADKNIKAGFTFEFSNLVSDSNGDAETTYWNNELFSHSTNLYFATSSTLNRYLNNDDGLFHRLPDYLQSYIEPVYKKVGMEGDLTIAKEYETKLFPLAEEEIGVYGKPVTIGEGDIYQYYAIHTEMKYKKKVDINSHSNKYWLRSPLFDNKKNDRAWNIDVDGKVESSLIYSNPYEVNLYGVAPGFCI